MSTDPPAPAGREGFLLSRLRTLSANRRERLSRYLEPPRDTGYALLAEALRCCGLKRVLGVSGVPVDEVFAQCARRGIRPIGMRHQQAAALAAAAGNFIAGQMDSAVVISAGPAVTNALTGVLTARDNGWPLLVMGGRCPVQAEGTGYFQELDGVGIYRPVTKWAAAVPATSALQHTVLQAYELACQGRPGPVYLDLPQDVLSSSAAISGKTAPALEDRSDANASDVDKVAALVREAERPLLILGEGIRWSYHRASLNQLVNDSCIPFITTPLGRGVLPDGHPHCQNAIRRWVHSQADLVLMVGAWFDWRFRFGAELKPTTKIVHVDIDPTTLGRNVRDALVVHADAGRFLAQLAEAMAESRPSRKPATLDAWHQQLQIARQKRAHGHARWLALESRPMLPQQLFRALAEALPLDTLIVLDGSVCLSAGQMVLSAEREWSWLDPGWSGCMGAGIPFGIGAKLAAPDRPVLVVCGDFAFGLSAMELETAVRHAIPIIVVVANNDGITGTTRQSRHFPADYPELFSRFLPAVRYDRLMEVFGGYAAWVEEPRDIGPALERALQSNRPACLNVRVKPDAPHPGFW
jgi:thiamine pyrophosphate-dependent acetolactate synthase large subunit-like protein